MVNLSKIKLIIWDLDETLWQGTLSEGDVSLADEMKRFFFDTLDMGIVHSICSKNDFEVAKAKLDTLGLWDCFVFPSIDWSPKGSRIKTVIEKMALRQANVLFVDDNIQNLKEAIFFCKDIVTASPVELKELYPIADAAEKKDSQHKRLNQYKILETKDNVRGSFDSNTSFLMSCNIKVSIDCDCIDSAERIHELIMRSNQLNYTKFRQGLEELKALILDKSVNCGIVKVTDNYGDYGIVGFFAIKDGRAIHYLFSCRTLGMLVEQYVYMLLKCPEIDVKGEVATELNNRDMPQWINNLAAQNQPKNSKKSINGKILFKGPCDLLQIFSFIHKSDNIVTEFTYTNSEGILVEGQNHTGSIVTAITHDKEECDSMLNEFSWLDSNMLTTSLADTDYDFVFFSMLTDSNLGLYKRKGTDKMISLCEAYYDMTDSKNHNGYLSGEIYNSNIKFTEADLKDFSEKYEYADNSDGELTVKNLDVIYQKISHNSKLVLLLGSEIPFDKDNRPSYAGRSNVHSALNRKIEGWAADKKNVILVNLGSFIENDNDYADSVNHFTKRVYYKMAEEIVSIMNDGNFTLKMKKPSAIILSNIKDFIKKMIHRA